MDQNARQQIIDRLKDANNVLVTVSANPSVDQLAACIAFTLLLNHLGKHGTAVFSGRVPSTIEFLKPEETIEKNTDSLRDFIIALDKSKADKLRYKVEDKVVKIFITPYRTSLSDKDLEFSQGDFNVDAVVALGVHERTDLDKAIMAHGRILHDATVISVNNQAQGEIGTINWIDLNASSLSEMLYELAKGISAEPLDAQMATAFMTGVVAETDRFSNKKTSPRTMAIASDLMAAGANQQLIATKLDEAKPVPAAAAGGEGKDVASQDGSLQISHEGKEGQVEPTADPAEESTSEEEPEFAPAESEEPAPVAPEPDQKDDEIDSILNNLDSNQPPETSVSPSRPVLMPPPSSDPSNIGSIGLEPPVISRATDKTVPTSPTEPASVSSNMVMEPPSLGGQLTANSEPDHLRDEPSADPLSLPSVNNEAPPLLLNRPANLYGTPIQPPDNDVTSRTDKPLTVIENAVGSPHAAGNDTPLAPLEEPQAERTEDAREAVDDAIATDPTPTLDPIQSLGAQPVNLDLKNDVEPPSTPEPAIPTDLPAPAPDAAMDTPAEEPLNVVLPPIPDTNPGDDEPPSAVPPPLSDMGTAPVPNDLPVPNLSLTPPPASVPSLMSPPAPISNPFGAPPDMNGVNPNPTTPTSFSNPDLPSSLMPQSPPTDPTAAGANPAPPPPVPPPLMPPTDGTNTGAPL